MTESQLSLLNSFYVQYNDTIKPLIALYEAREETFPTPIFNEIRAFNDHIARCHLKDVTEDFVERQLHRAGRHITRIILDCYKYLNVSFYIEVERFQKATKNIDLSIIDNGRFIVQFREARNEAISLIRLAKKSESMALHEDEIFQNFENAFNKYVSITELINNNYQSINWAKSKQILKRFSWVWAAIVSAIISLILTNIFHCQLFTLLIRLFKPHC